MSLTLIRATALSLAPSVGQICHQVALRPSPVSQWEEQMPIFIYRGRYSADAVKGMMTSPQDREAALAKVFEKAGGKLLAFYLTFGEGLPLPIVRTITQRSRWPSQGPLAAASAT
jgi:hypothetical protein